jgi:hypothetical protein
MESPRIEVKKLELHAEGNWFKRKLSNPHTKKSLVYMLVGGAGGFIYFYLTQGQHMDVLTANDIFKSIGIGAFFGFFITNSPCARGRC